jgi:hypothetical protein
LERLTAALESHFAAATSGRGEDDPAFLSAYETLIDAFETYDEALYEACGIDLPFIVYDEDADDDEDDDDDAGDDLFDDDDDGIDIEFDDEDAVD